MKGRERGSGGSRGGRGKKAKKIEENKWEDTGRGKRKFGKEKNKRIKEEI